MLFDCFSFFNELDLLEVRLHELHALVDYFVLVEARRTFQGEPKPLYFTENADRFRIYASKIIPIVVDFPEASDAYGLDTKPLDANWAREHYQRNQIAKGLANASASDLIIVSDVDEILSATALRRAIADRKPGELTIFEMPVYRGSANRRVRSPPWDKGPRLIEYRQFPGAQRLRMTKICASGRLRGMALGGLHARAWNWINTGIWAPVRVIPDAGWHITSLGDWETWRRKIASYSHAEHKSAPSFECSNAYAKMIADQTDIVAVAELPDFIRQNPERFILA
jgi:beta-1,4-mannosyl-glycoprotein beta-1,4-N-acetylglucosaminyltransferase